MLLWTLVMSLNERKRPSGVKVINVILKEMANDIVGGIVRLAFSRVVKVNVIVVWCVNPF